MLLIWTIDLTAQHAPLNVEIIWSVWFFQIMRLSICTPRNFVFTVSSIYFSFEQDVMYAWLHTSATKWLRTALFWDIM